jgi:hypothetical protein
LEWDFREILHVDALDWVARKRNWAQFLRFTDMLSRRPGSAYHSALMLNPELAVERKKLKKAKNPQLFGWTSEMHLLADIADILYKTAAHDPNVALPRPLTALDHLSLMRRQAAMNRTVMQFSPHHAHLTPQLEA